MNWEQHCYLVIADSVPGNPPLLHGMKLTQWEAFRVLEQVHGGMPAKLTQNLRVVPASLNFSDGAENPAAETDEQ